MTYAPKCLQFSSSKNLNPGDTIKRWSLQSTRGWTLSASCAKKQRGKCLITFTRTYKELLFIESEMYGSLLFLAELLREKNWWNAMKIELLDMMLRSSLFCKKIEANRLARKQIANFFWRFFHSSIFVFAFQLILTNNGTFSCCFFCSTQASPLSMPSG